MCARVQELTGEGWSLDAIARDVEADGYAPLRSGQHWSVPSVQTLRRQLGLGNTRRRGSSRAALGPDEWWAREVAGKLDLSPSSLLYWIESGVVRARKENGGWRRRAVGGGAGERGRRSGRTAARQRSRHSPSHTHSNDGTHRPQRARH